MTKSAAIEQNNTQKTQDQRLQTAFQKTVEEGRIRLERSWASLIATGLVGGIDISFGVLALLVIVEASGSRLLGALGFSIGFIAVTLAKSELFTENFLVPVTAVFALKSKTFLALLRLWVVTAVMNLISGWFFAWLIVLALPRLRQTAIESSAFFIGLSLSESIALGVIAGAAITLMTWMQHSSETEFGKIVAVVSAAFLLAAVPLNHVIVASLEMFVALHAGAPFGYIEWMQVAAIATGANMLGGLLLVTMLRLIQVVGADVIEK